MADSSLNRVSHIINLDGCNGSVIIPDDAFAVIACFAALEVEGVHSVDGNITKEKLPKVSYNNLAGVKIEIKEEKIKVYVAVSLNFGVNIPDVVVEIQDKVKTAIESMTGFTVSKIHIKISDIYVG